MKITSQGSGMRIKFTASEVAKLKAAADVLRELEKRSGGAPQDAYQALCSLDSLRDMIDAKGNLEAIQ